MASGRHPWQRPTELVSHLWSTKCVLTGMVRVCAALGGNVRQHSAPLLVCCAATWILGSACASQSAGPVAAVRLPPVCADVEIPGLIFSGLTSETSVNIFGLMSDETVAALTNDGLSSAASFSPDGSSIVFTRASYDSPTAGSPAQPSEIWLMAPDGTKAQRLAVLAAADVPTFSPDGQSIALVGNAEPGTPGLYIYVLNAQTDELE